MIDIDKYEGHTEDIERWQMMGRSLPDWANDKDEQLVRDAVYLLEEVKRLREEVEQMRVLKIVKENERLREALITVQQSLVWDEKDRAMDGDPITLEALVAQVEQVRSDITEMR